MLNLAIVLLSIFTCALSCDTRSEKHDMRVLFTLILTFNIYFGCVIYEALRFPKLYTIMALTSVSNNYVVVSMTNSDNELRSGNESNHHPSIHSSPCRRAIQRFAANKSAQVRPEKIAAQRFRCKRARSDLCSRFRTCARVYRRKLLGQIFRADPVKRSKSCEMYQRAVALKKSRSRDRKRDDVAEDTELENEDTDSEAWDNWSNWSACSVTCGRGRQVRWRHCLSGNCVRGLKKAQMKNCHRKDCSKTKGFLGWLGIKT